MESKNPAFNNKTIEKMRSAGAFATTDGVMTVEGAINKTGILVTLTVLSAAFSWSLSDSSLGPAFGIGGGLIAFILSFVIIFNQSKAATLAPIYAVCEGLILGMLSYMTEARYPGVVFNAFTLTFGILFTMIFLYKFQIIRATEKLRIGIVSAMMAICLTYFVDLILGFFGHPITLIHGSSTAGLVLSGVVIVVAALNFILDFDMIDKAAAARAPKYMEWYSGFAVLLTIVWLYVEVLRLLSRIRER